LVLKVTQAELALHLVIDQAVEEVVQVLMDTHLLGVHRALTVVLELNLLYLVLRQLMLEVVEAVFGMPQTIQKEDQEVAVMVVATVLTLLLWQVKQIEEGVAQVQV
jgi:hypothetical protein